MFEMYFLRNIPQMFRSKKTMELILGLYLKLFEEMEEIKLQLLKDFGTQTKQGSIQDILVRWEYVKNMDPTPIIALLRYLFECLVTALLICFGAPLWNDIVTYLFRLQKGKTKRQLISEEENNA